MNHAYQIQPVSAMRQHPELLPDVPGLYALILDHPDALAQALERARLALEPVKLGRRPVLYLGATDDSLRRRLKCHLSDDTGRSTFRMSLGAVLAEQLGLIARPSSGERYFMFEPESEMTLSRWISEHVSVAVKPRLHARRVESRLIFHADPLLNIASRRPSDQVAGLTRMRRQCLGLPFAAETLN